MHFPQGFLRNDEGWKILNFNIDVFIDYIDIHMLILIQNSSKKRFIE